MLEVGGSFKYIGISGSGIYLSHLHASSRFFRRQTGGPPFEPRCSSDRLAALLRPTPSRPLATPTMPWLTARHTDAPTTHA